MKKFAAVLVIVLMSLSLTGCGKKYYIRNLEQDIEDRDEKIEQLEQQIADMDSEKMELLAERDYLQIELDKSNSNVKRLESELSARDDSYEEVYSSPASYVIDNGYSSYYVSTVFYPDPNGKLYSSKVQWFSNPLCVQGTEVNSDVVIVSPVVRNDEYNNGFTFYSCMSSNGLVYSNEAPNLEVR